MNPIASALGLGYSAQHILRYLSQHNPHMAKRINEALEAGHSVDHILGFLSRNEKRLKKFMPNQAQPQQSQNLYKQAQQSIHPSLKGMAQAGLSAGLGLGASAYALSRAAPRIIPEVLGPLQQSQMLGLPNEQEQHVNIEPLQEEKNTAQTKSAEPQVSELPKRNPQLNIDRAKNLGEEGRIRNLLEGGMQPADIDSVLKKLLPKDKYQALKASEGGIEGLIEDIEYSLKNSEKEIPSKKELIPFKLDVNSPQTEILEEEIKPISKKDQVISPHGIGEVKEIRNGKALINIDGKIHKIDEDQLISSALQEKELAELYGDLIRGIEKETGEEVSRMANFVGYDPESNTLAFLPHDGGLYIYNDISPQQKDFLTSALSTRKTSGSNFIGAWTSGSRSPIGAAMSKLIKELQQEAGGKGKEYAQKFTTVYNALEPAIKASKLKKKKK